MTSTWTILKTIEWLTDYFKEKGIENPRLDAEYIISHVLDIKRLDLYLNFDRILEKDELAGLKPLIKRRAAREPLQHILGRQPFHNVDVKVNKDVLIPRPETEILVDEVLKHIPVDKQLSILDIGTGSGAIILALAHERRLISLTGTDISAEALATARTNTESLGDRVVLKEGDLFDPVRNRVFDIIVSNPPYIPTDQWPRLAPEIRNYEPHRALVAGREGLDFYRRIIDDAPHFLKEGGWLLLEIGDGQREAVSKFLEDKGSFKNIQIRKDLNNTDRVISAQRVLPCKNS